MDNFRIADNLGTLGRSLPKRVVEKGIRDLEPRDGLTDMALKTVLPQIFGEMVLLWRGGARVGTSGMILTHSWLKNNCRPSTW